MTYQSDDITTERPIYENNWKMGMTIGELREALAEFDYDAPISNYFGSSGITGIYVRPDGYVFFINNA